MTLRLLKVKKIRTTKVQPKGQISCKLTKIANPYNKCVKTGNFEQVTTKDGHLIEHTFAGVKTTELGYCPAGALRNLWVFVIVSSRILLWIFCDGLGQGLGEDGLVAIYYGNVSCGRAMGCEGEQPVFGT